MRQVLGPGAVGRLRGIRWRGRWEEGSGWGIHVTPWLIHVNVWQNPLQCCEVISLQLIKINEKEKKDNEWVELLSTHECSLIFQGRFCLICFPVFQLAGWLAGSKSFRLSTSCTGVNAASLLRAAFVRSVGKLWLVVATTENDVYGEFSVSLL